MASRPWEAQIWQQASDLIQQAERIQRNFLQIVAGAAYHGASGRVSCWSPPVNVIETDQGLWVLSALPGVQPERMEARLESGELVITGEGSLPSCCREGELKIWEIPMGRFERRVRLPAVQSPSIETVRFQDGLLIIELRKKP
ncbi:MAG: Hsp20/alpha crystallin family protein [Deltaproteobacteria bacterium]|nr:Hsp20/alpha crystallin family protein [Deltaproteobacteria bacterium]